MSKFPPVKPRKVLTAAQKEHFRKPRGTPAPPTKRDPAELRELSPEEHLHERIEERRLRKAWDEGRLTKTLRGYGGA